MTFTLRPFAPADRDACASILEALPEWFGLADANAGYVAGLTPANARVVFDGNQEVVAFLGLTDHGEGSWEIEVMGVRPALHGAGIGRRLVALIENEAAHAGTGEVRLHADARLHGNLEFYRRLGYRERYRRGHSVLFSRPLEVPIEAAA